MTTAPDRSTSPAPAAKRALLTLCAAGLALLAPATAAQRPDALLPGRTFELVDMGGTFEPSGLGSAFGDFDGDGRLDAATAGVDGGDKLANQRLDVVFGTGVGQFTQPVSLGAPTTQNFRGLVAGDVTGDGIDDLVHAEFTGGAYHLIVYAGDGAGGFDEQAPGPVYLQRPSLLQKIDGLELVDIDADGDLDLLSAERAWGDPNHVGRHLALFENLGGGVFDNFVSLGSIAESSGLVSADLDGDGLVDALAYDPGTGAVTALFAVDGALPVALDTLAFTAPTGAQAYRLGDADGDGDADLLGFSLFGELPTWLALGDGSGEFAPATTLPAAFTAFWVEPADLDADGVPDLVLVGPADTTGAAVSVARGLGGGAFADPELLMAPVFADRLLVHDVDGNGALDVLAIEHYGAGATGTSPRVSALLAGPAGDFGLQDPFGADATPRTVDEQQLVDVDGDGRVDLLQVLDDATLRVQLALPGGGVAAPIDLDMGLDEPGASHVRDLDHDGRPDLALVGELAGANVLALRFALPGGGFAPATQLALGARNRVSFGDLDGAHGLDVVAGGGTSFPTQIETFLAQPGGGFASSGTATTTPWYSRFVLVDATDDGLDDLLLTGDPVRLLESDGAGGYLPELEVLDSFHANVATGDLDGDGRLDLVLARSNLLRVMQATDPGPYVLAESLFVPDTSASDPLQLVDADGDGQLDIVVDGARVILFGDGAFGFEEQHGYTSSGEAWLGELTGDGALDLVSIADDERHAVLFAGLGASPWTGLGNGLAGTAGQPLLQGIGSLEAGSIATLALNSARPFAPATLVVGLARIDAPFKAGVLVPAPDKLLPPQITSALGLAARNLPVPPGFSGIELFWQSWVADPAAPSGFAASNALSGVLP